MGFPRDVAQLGCDAPLRRAALYLALFVFSIFSLHTSAEAQVAASIVPPAAQPDTVRTMAAPVALQPLENDALVLVRATETGSGGTVAIAGSMDATRSTIRQRTKKGGRWRTG